MRIYLDNNATTPIDSRVLERLTEMSSEVFGNASSIHTEGQKARRALEEAREAVAELIHSSSRELIFTSGGTESNNTAILGVALRHWQSCHFVTSAIEHPSMLEGIRNVKRFGHEVTVVPCDANGIVNPDAVREALRPETKFVGVMLANNETGVVQPIREIAAIARERDIHFHCDAVQAAGRIAIDVDDLGVDTLSLSAHKMHGPKGIGALYVKKGTILDPMLRGGAQERRRRAGTESVPLAAAFGEAAKIAVDLEPMKRVAGLRDSIEAAMRQRFPETIINGGESQRVPNTTNLRFRGCDAEGIVIGLDLNAVAVSTGSACSSGRVEPSHVLIAMGLSEEDARSSVRVSLSRLTTEDEIRMFIGLLEELVPKNKREQARTA